MSFKRVFVLCCAWLLASCATYQPVPKDYTGPTASVRDTGFSEDGTKAQMFALVEVDGNRIMNAFWASANASQGRGASLSTVFPERQVQARAMKVKLQGSHATGAPIHAMASQLAGTFFSVEGVVDFTPKANGRYAVKGELKKGKASVWIEDAETGQPATTIVSK
jgi:hypothetical protein